MLAAMTDVLSTAGERLFQARVSKVAASALAADFTRHPGPKHGLVVGADPDSPVLTAAIDALTPDDQLTVVGAKATDELRTRVRLAGAWVEKRVETAKKIQDMIRSTR